MALSDASDLVRSLVMVLERVSPPADSLADSSPELDTVTDNDIFALRVPVRRGADGDEVGDEEGERDGEEVPDAREADEEGDELLVDDSDGVGESESDGEVVGSDRDGVGVSGGVIVRVSVIVLAGRVPENVLLREPVMIGFVSVCVCVGVAGGVIVSVLVADLLALAVPLLSADRVNVCVAVELEVASVVGD